jgi:hypothetical protein
MAPCRPKTGLRQATRAHWNKPGRRPHIEIPAWGGMQASPPVRHKARPLATGDPCRVQQGSGPRSGAPARSRGGQRHARKLDAPRAVHASDRRAQLSSVAGMRTLNAGDVVLGASSRRQHRFGNTLEGCARHAYACSPAPQVPGLALLRCVSSRAGSALGMRIGFRRGGPDGAARVCANLAWAGYMVTAGDVRGEFDSMVAGRGRWGGTRDEVAAEAES